MNKQTFTEYQLCARPSDAILMLFVWVECYVCADAGNRGRVEESLESFQG